MPTVQERLKRARHTINCADIRQQAMKNHIRELESQLAASQAECERLRRENLELLGVCPDCKESLYWCECTKHGGSLSHDEV